MFGSGAHAGKRLLEYRLVEGRAGAAEVVGRVVATSLALLVVVVRMSYRS